MLPHRLVIRNRKGTAAVELAVCLPLVLALTFGTIETTSFISLHEKLLTAAYEAARTTSGPGQTSSAGVAAGTGVLTARGIKGGSVTVLPDPVTAATTAGTEIAATAAAPFSSNSWMLPFVLGEVGDVTVTVKMMRQ